jgi:hypothetical protein
LYEIDGWTAPILDGTWHGASLDAMMRSLQVVHPETNEVLGRLVGEGAEGKNHVPEHSRVGVIWAKGPQITKGYYRSGLTSLHLYQVTCARAYANLSVLSASRLSWLGRKQSEAIFSFTDVCMFYKFSQNTLLWTGKLDHALFCPVNSNIKHFSTGARACANVSALMHRGHVVQELA